MQTYKSGHRIEKILPDRVREYEQLKAIRELKEIIKRIPQAPKEVISNYIREDRGNH